MLHKCANASCSVPFRRLSEGKLFQVETPTADLSVSRPGGRMRSLRKVEHFWLCDDCSSHLTLAFEQERGIITVPIPLVPARKPPETVEYQFGGPPLKHFGAAR